MNKFTRGISGFVIFIALGLLMTLNVTFPQSASAAVNASCSRSFLGIPTWYAYLNLESSDKDTNCTVLNDNGEPLQGINDISSVLPKVIIALIDALLRISGVVAFVYVVISGFKFVFAQGNPDKEKQARSALFNAVIGMMIAMSAAFVVSFIGKRLS